VGQLAELELPLVPVLLLVGLEELLGDELLGVETLLGVLSEVGAVEVDGVEG
jgi:hypothetical protein